MPWALQAVQTRRWQAVRLSSRGLAAGLLLSLCYSQAELQEVHLPSAKRLTELNVASRVLRELDMSSCTALEVQLALASCAAVCRCLA